MKKQRGQKRKIEKLLRNIEEFLPFQERQSEFEHFHVPSSPWIESPKTSARIKTLFVKKWLEKTSQFLAMKPKDLPFCKVVAVIDYPHLWSSQILIFYSEEYYKSFWDRNDSYQQWEVMEDKKFSFVKSRNIHTNLVEKGYLEFLKEEEFTAKSELWFYGDL